MILERTQENIFAYLDNNPEVEVKKLYIVFGAVEPNHQAAIRSIKSKWKKLKQKNPKWVSDKKKEKFLKLPLIEIVRRFREFVGYLDENGVVIEGEAFPPPIDEKGQYLGILKHELRAFVLIWIYLKTGIMFKWPRGFGKTFICTWFIEFTMKELAWPWMYLSVTEILSDVADWIFRWASIQNLISKTIRGGKRNTYKGFNLKTGGKMRIYDYLGEEMVGQHNWYLALDDIVKKKWDNKPSDNLKAKRQWNYSISFIRRLGLLILGTRKFEGDPLEYLENALSPKGLHIETKTPYIMDGEFPDWLPVIDEETGQEELWVPELATWEELEDKKLTHDDPEVDPYLAFQAEMMQNPLPRVGGLCEDEDILYRKIQPLFKETRMVGIGVDSAWTEGETSDNTGIITCVMFGELIERRGRARPRTERRFCYLNATIGRLPIYTRTNKRTQKTTEGILEVITRHYNHLKRYYPHVPLIVAIERNGAGIAIIDAARQDFNKYPWARFIIEDSSPAYKRKRKINPKTPIRLGITHSKEKYPRIFAELSEPIKKQVCQFMEGLYGSELIKELTTFPRARYDDGADAAGMIKDELSKRWSNVGISEVKKELTRDLKEVRVAMFREERRQELFEPWKRPEGGLFD